MYATHNHELALCVFITAEAEKKPKARLADNTALSPEADVSKLASSSSAAAPHATPDWLAHLSRQLPLKYATCQDLEFSSVSRCPAHTLQQSWLP